jgi:hypothetical protein
MWNNGSSPTRTVVASGSSMGSGAALPLALNPKIFPSGLSFRLFFMREPLKPTKATPAITVIKESHLNVQVRQDAGKRRREDRTGIAITGAEERQR